MLDEGLESINNQGIVTFEGTILIYIAFADDALANNDEQVIEKIHILNRNMEILGMKINSDKSAICYINFLKGKLTINYKATSCIINDKEIPQIDYNIQIPGNKNRGATRSGTTIEQVKEIISPTKN